jgi:hypothetical protein
MGDMYLLLELNDEAVRWINRDWIARGAMPRLSELTPRETLPTLGQLKSVLAALEPYCVTYSNGKKSLEVEVRHRDGYGAGWSTTLWAESSRHRHRSPRSDHEQIRLTYHKGNPELAVLITERLARECGPLLLVSANDGIPLVVTPGIDVDQAVDGWMNCWHQSESSPNKA